MGIVLDFLLDQGSSPALDILGSRAGPVPGHPNPDDELIKADTTNSTAHCCLCYHYVHSSGTFQFHLKKKTTYSVFLATTEMRQPRPGEQIVSFIRNKKLNFEYYLIASARFGWLRHGLCRSPT